VSERSGYDLEWGPDWQGPRIVQHFCREWDADGEGCYGTNPNHGYPFDLAVREVIEWWSAVSEDALFPPWDDDKEDA
jgi:hypothetical protein